MAHPTHIFYVPVSAKKKGSQRHQMPRVFPTLPPSRQCWWCEEGEVILPAKKDSLSARQQWRRYVFNIDDGGEGLEHTCKAWNVKGTFFRRHRYRKKTVLGELPEVTGGESY